MRVLMVHPGPDFSVHDVFEGWREALESLGVEVAVYNLNDRLVFYSNILVNTHEMDETGHPICNSLSQDQVFNLATAGLTDALYTFAPQVVLFVSAFFTTERLFQNIRAHGHKIVILHTESPYQDDEQMMRGKMADLNMLNDPANLDTWQAMGIPAIYMPHAYRPAIHRPRTGLIDSNLACDLAFVGTAFKSRVEFFEAMDLSGLDVLLAGNHWGQTTESSPLAKFVATGIGTEADCVTNPEAAEIYRSAKCGINIYRREGEETHANDQPYAMGPREVEMAACGLFYLRDSRPEGDAILPMLPRFAGPEDAGEILRYYLDHDSEREKAAAQARATLAHRTFENNAKWLLRLLKM